MSDKNTPGLRKFLETKEITFESVDTCNDKKVLQAEWIFIPEKYHIDIQTLYRIPGKGLKAGMGDIAAELVDPSYKMMKPISGLCQVYTKDMISGSGNPLPRLTLTMR